MTTAALRATPGRVIALALGVPIMLAAAAWTAFSFVGILGRTSAHFHTSYAWSRGPVSLDVNDGSVQIRPGDTSRVDVEYTEHYEFKRPTVGGVSTSNGVALTGHCSGGVFGQNCQINYVITVPRQAALQLHLGDGSLTLQGISAPIVARTGDGSIHGTALRSPTVDASVGDGSVKLQWVAAPARVTSMVGTGSIDLTVPRGSGPYAIDRSGSSGGAVTVATDPAATAKLELHVGNGSVNVRYGR